MNKVELHKVGRAKFVLMKNGEHYVLRSSPYAEFHREIVRETKLPSYDCVGGGRLEITDTKIRAFGYSVDFGTAPSEIVEKLLKEHVGDSGTEIRVEMGKGY